MTRKKNQNETKRKCDSQSFLFPFFFFKINFEQIVHSFACTYTINSDEEVIVKKQNKIKYDIQGEKKEKDFFKLRLGISSEVSNFHYQKK